jgi:TonB family protein
MGRRPFVGYWLILLLVLTLHPSFAGENKQAAYKAALQKASAVTDIFGDGPLRMRATFRLISPSGELDGSYVYTRLSNEQVREDIDTKDFAESIVRNGAACYILRSKTFEPLPVVHLRQLIYLTHSVVDAGNITKTTTTPQNPEIKCYAMERGGYGTSEFYGYEACFNENSAALSRLVWSFNTDWHKFEYSDFLPDSKKVFPRTMRRIHNGKLVAEAKVDSIDHGPFDVKLLDPLPNASKQDSCGKFKPASANFDPQYFEIRSKNDNGSVVIAGSVDDHGRIGATEIQQSAGSSVDEAALKALTKLRIQPAKCDGHAVPSKFRLHIWFSPAPHPDGFESFRDDSDSGIILDGGTTALGIVPGGTIYESNHR